MHFVLNGQERLILSKTMLLSTSRPAAQLDICPLVRFTRCTLQHSKLGRSGNDVLLATLKAMKATGIDGHVYSHPIEDRGHGTSPLIGLWNHQESVPGLCVLLLQPRSWLSIELSVTIPVPE